MEFTDILLEIESVPRQRRIFLEAIFPERSAKQAGSERLPSSNGYLGQDVHATNLGRHAEFGALAFDPDNRGLAAHPALFARS